MSEIQILENKKLVLKNVIKHSISSLPINDIDKEVQKFNTILLSHNPKTFGPLIICNKGSHVSDNGEITVDIDILAQAHEYKKMKEIYLIEDAHECKHCLVARYNGPAELTQLAYNKLEIYIYEHDLLATGLIYTLYKQSVENHACIDIFKQVEAI